MQVQVHVHAADSYLVYTENDIKLIENNLNRNFNYLVHFDVDKTKLIIFVTKRKLKSIHELAGVKLR